LVAKYKSWNKFFKNSLLLNAVIMNIFLTLNMFTNFGNNNLALTAIYFAIFMIVLVLVNYVVYQFYKRNNKE